MSDDDTVCVDCEEQKIESRNTALSGHVHKSCETIYSKVEMCMIKNKGRVAPCQNEWNEFRDCHANTREDRLNLK